MPSDRFRNPSNDAQAFVAVIVTGFVAATVASGALLGMNRLVAWGTPTPYVPPKVDVSALADPEAYARGKEHFLGTCAACHGPNGEGMPGSGKPLLTSEFVKSQTDDQMVAFITSGRPSWDPANTTGIDMPPKGGNPVLNGDNIKDIVAFLRGLQASAKK